MKNGGNGSHVRHVYNACVIIIYSNEIDCKGDMSEDNYGEIVKVQINCS